MRKAFLIRFESGDHGTFGKFYIPGVGYEAYTAEPPWRDNQKGLSCIPSGEYLVQPRKSPKYGWCFHVTNVEGRTWILNHSGNFAGDTQKGLKSHTMGCLLHGQKLGILAGQKAVLNSRVKIQELERLTNLEPFKLTIRWLS